MKLDSRYGLLGVVALRKSLSAKRTPARSSYPNNPVKFVKPPGCQIHVKSAISGLSCPSANKNNNFSKFLSMGKSHQHSSISLSKPQHHTLAEAAGWELTVFSSGERGGGTRTMGVKEHNGGQEDDWKEAPWYLEGTDSRSKVCSGRWNRSTLRMRQKLFLLLSDKTSGSHEAFQPHAVLHINTLHSTKCNVLHRQMSSKMSIFLVQIQKQKHVAYIAYVKKTSLCSRHTLLFVFKWIRLVS